MYVVVACNAIPGICGAEHAEADQTAAGEKLKVEGCNNAQNELTTLQYGENSELLVGNPSFIARRLENQLIQG